MRHRWRSMKISTNVYFATSVDFWLMKVWPIVSNAAVQFRLRLKSGDAIIENSYFFMNPDER
jgi:hypothetical protein